MTIQKGRKHLTITVEAKSEVTTIHHAFDEKLNSFERVALVEIAILRLQKLKEELLGL